MEESASAKTYHHGNLRAELLDAAVLQLRETGIEDLSLRALARAIGVSQTAPYRHFADKGELLAAMATDARDREPLLAQTVFESHPALSGCEIVHLEPGQRQVIGQPFDGIEARVRGGVKEEADETRPDGPAGDAPGGFVC